MTFPVASIVIGTLLPGGSKPTTPPPPPPGPTGPSVIDKIGKATVEAPIIRVPGLPPVLPGISPRKAAEAAGDLILGLVDLFG